MENQINVGSQKAQQIRQNPVIQPTPIPEKPKVNYWMITTIILVVFFVVSISLLFYFLSRNHNTFSTFQNQTENPQSKTTPTQTIPEKPISVRILGIKDNKLNEFNIINNSFNNLNIPMDPKWTYRLSPDKKKIFISTYELWTEGNQQANFYVYSLGGQKLYEGRPKLGNGYDSVGLQYSSGFGREYFTWDNKSEGILYMISGTVSRVTDGIGEAKKVQFRYISLADGVDTSMYDEQKDYGETEDTISGYLPESNLVIRSFIGSPGVTTNAYTINIKTKAKQDIISFNTSQTHLEKKISPDGKFVVGIVSNIDSAVYLQKDNPFSVFVKSTTNPNQKFDLSSLAKYTPDGSFLKSGDDIFFIDNQTVAAIHYRGDELGRTVLIDFVNSKVLSTNETTPLDQSRLKVKSLEMIVSIDDGYVLTDKRIITANSEVYLPENFIPVSVFQ